MPTAAPELALSWPRWVDAAEAMGEDALATRLVVTGPADALDPEHGDLVLARSAVLRGRPQEAVDLLEGTILGQPAAAHASQVVAAAARASTSDDDEAYRWLLGHASFARRNGEGWLALRLVAAVADARGDTATADRAWQELVASAGWRTPEALARLAVTTVARRDRDDRFSVPAHAHEAARVSLVAPRTRHPDVGPATEAAATLARRGDPAGALLLLRAVRSTVRGPGDRRVASLLRVAESEHLPRSARLAFVVQRAGVVLLGAGAGVVTVLATSSAWWPLVPVLAVVANLLVRRHVRLGPFTTVERQVWRTLLRSRQDESTGVVVGPPQDLLGAAVAVVSVIVGLLPAALALRWMSERLIGWGWLQFVLFVLVMIAPALPSVAILSRVQCALRRRARRRREATDESQARAVAGHCACWDIAAVVGRSSVYYLEAHLVAVPADPVVARVLAAVGQGTTTARCPLSGVLWLVVPAGTADLLLLRGAMFAAEPDPSRHDRSFF